MTSRIHAAIKDWGSGISPKNDPETVSYNGASTTGIEPLEVDDALRRFAEEEWGKLEITTSNPTIGLTIKKRSGANEDDLSVVVKGDCWSSSDDPAAVTGTVTDHVCTLHQSLPSQHTYSLTWWDRYGMFRCSMERFESKDGPPKFDLPDMIGWLTIFGEDGIDRHGRDRLLAAPGWRVEELSNGHVLVVLTDDPTDHTAHAERYTEMLSYLGLDHLPDSTEIVYSS